MAMLDVLATRPLALNAHVPAIHSVHAHSQMHPYRHHCEVFSADMVEQVKMWIVQGDFSGSTDVRPSP